MKTISKIALMTFVCILSSFHIIAQNNKTIDSLKQELKKTIHDTIRLRILNTIIETDNNEKVWPVYNAEMKALAEKLLSERPDNKVLKSARKYLASSLNNIGFINDNQGNTSIAIEYYNKSIKLFEENGDKQGMATTFNSIGSVFSKIGDIPKALEYYHKGLATFELIGDKQGMAFSLVQIGFIYEKQGDVPQALEYFKKSLKVYEQIGDKQLLASSYISIGLFYIKIGDIQKALEYHNKSLNMYENAGNKDGMANALFNIGTIYSDEKNIHLALENLNKSLNLREETGNKRGILSSLQYFGAFYENQGDFSKALTYYSKSLVIAEEVGDKGRIIGSLNRIGNMYLLKNELQNAKIYAEKAYLLSKKTGYPEAIRRCASLLKDIYIKQGNYQKAFEYYQEEILMRDSVINEENFKKTQKQQAKYEYEKKAATDSISYNKAMEIKNLEVKKQRTVIWFAILGLIFMLAFAIFIFRSLRITRKQKILIVEQKLKVDEANEELNQQNEEIASQRDEIEAQRDTVTKQKEHIEHVHHEVSQSINYATRIQTAILPDPVLLNQYISEYFILFKPKDKVSGDFYWWAAVEGYLIITVADCTGHGVPGAFMSMLGTSFLREIVVKEYITSPAIILKRMRKEIILALKQKGEYGEQKDGMDMALISINTETLEMQYAGANNPLYLIRNGILTEYKADKMPVAIHDNMQAYTNHDILLNKGDNIYVMSDGYQDQFGGPNRKKFMSKNLKELLKFHSHKSMIDQKQVLENTIVDWIGDKEQIDDITIMGIKI